MSTRILSVIQRFLAPLTKRIFALRCAAASLFTTERPGEQALVTVDSRIIAPNPERFGANLEVSDYQPWDTNAPIFNNWTGDAGMEPIIVRYKGKASGGSGITIEQDGGPTAANTELVGSGFFDGATVRVYRLGDGAVQLLRKGQIARHESGAEHAFRLHLDAAGPPVLAGDIFFLTLERDDVTNADAGTLVAAGAWSAIWHTYPNWGDISAISKFRDSSTVAPRHGSRTSMRISISAAQEGGILQFITGSPENHDANSFRSGDLYRVELWLKQQGVADGKVRVWLHPFRTKIAHSFAVSDSWQSYQFTFHGVQHLRRSVFSQLNITFNGPGTIWVDDVRVYAVRQPAYAIDPEVLRAFRDFRPGTLRIWSGQTNTTWGTSLDNWLAPEGQGLRRWHPAQGETTGALFSLPTALAFARTTGATPWLIVHPSFDEDEWRNLIEYLAGPPSSPYGQIRAAAGQERPWSDEFARIRIEFGNETWNNLFHPWTFDNGKQYGQVAEHFFTAAKSSPYYAAVAVKIEFVLGGWTLSTGPNAYGTRARQASPSGATVALSAYLAGWDRQQIAAETRDEQFQNTLLYAPWVMHRLSDRQLGMRNLLAKMGVTLTFATSEGGAEYRLPEPGKETDPAEELFAKSLAAGVCTLDAFLYDSANGFGPQAFHAFGFGPRWSSHTTLRKGVRPHPAWLALQMRNLYAAGPMLATAITGGPRRDLPALDNSRYRIAAQPGVSLLAAYAFRQQDCFAVFVLSRQLTEATPVTLRLPVTAARATLYTLTGDPRATNLDRMRIKIRRRTIRNFGADYNFAMPPGSIYLFVIDGTKPAPDR